MAEEVSAVSERLGLIAGDGDLPALIARAAHRSGALIHAVGFPGITDPSLEEYVDRLDWVRLGQVAAVLESLHGAGVKDALLAGKVTKAHLYQHRDSLELDAMASSVLGRLADRADDSLLLAIADLLAEEGIALRAQSEFVPELLAPAGPLGRHRPTQAELEDVRFGARMARELGRLDVGQTVVVARGAVLALEAVEGTDAAIARGCELGGPGGVVVKLAKPNQDPRFDVPAVGPGTLRAAMAGRARVLAFETGQTLLLDRPSLVSEADRAEIVLLGITPGILEASVDAFGEGAG